MQRGRGGFTLIEMLVAMAVLSVLSVLSFRGLNSILDAEAKVQAETRRWNDVSLLVAQMGEDVAMVIDRPVRDSQDRMSPALILRGAAAGTGESDEAQLIMTRLGRGDGGTAQGGLRRVGYRLRDGSLEYLVWPAADQAPGAVPIAEPVLGEVTELEIRALDQAGAWLGAWPTAGAANALPRAVAVQIGFAGGERISRILPLR